MKNFLQIESTHAKRAIQTLIAAMVAISIYKTLNLGYGYWIALSAIITIQATTGASIKKAKDRLLGTIMGVLIGVALINIFPPNNLFLLFIVPLLIFLTIYLFSSSYSYSIFFVSILLVILMANNNLSPWHFAFARIADTAIGLAIGLAASYLLWPNASQDELQRDLQKTVFLCQDYFKAITSKYLDAQPMAVETSKEQIENALLISINSFKAFSYEPGIMKVTAEAIYAFIVSINSIYSYLLTLNLAACQPNLQYLSARDIQTIKQFIEKINQGFNQIALNFSPNKQVITFDFNTFITDIPLIQESTVKMILTEGNQSKWGLILFACHLKNIAFELKYMNQAVTQLTRVHDDFV